jgi:imidazolonepropionase-like amidohydrolase
MKTPGSLLIAGATLIDGVAEQPLQDRSIWIDGGRIKAIGGRDELGVPPTVQVIDARGKYAIPGLMNANVHLFMAINLEGIARYLDRYEEVIAESAQVALKHGLTTVFDTWGPRRALMAVRDRINAGAIPGSRVFCAGNIIGLDGPFSLDFFPKALEVATAAFAKRINAIWVENVGRHLMWLTPEQVAKEVRAYIGRGIDFIKYASNDHFPGAFLAFSPRQQAAVVEAAHRAGLTAQAHSMSVEGLRIAIEAGCDLVTHCNITGPVPIPDTTLELFAQRKTGAVIFPFMKRGLDWIMANVSEAERTMWQASDTNARNLIRSGAPLLLANDGGIVMPEWSTDPQWGKTWVTAPSEDNLATLATGHFVWFKAMEEKGCPPMEMLRAATRNIAVAYGKDQDLGTIQPGKIADMLILDKNPLQAAEHYRSIHSVIKDGTVVDRDALPLNPILTRPMEPPTDAEASYVPFLVSSAKFPMCPMCMCR